MASPSMLGQVYSILFRRTSTFALTIAVGALFFERAFDQGGDAIYDSINQGVGGQRRQRTRTVDGDSTSVAFVFSMQKLWKHVKHRWEEK